MKYYAISILFALLFSACTREDLTQDMATPTLAAYGPTNPCGGVTPHGLVESALLQNRGTVYTANDEDDFMLDFQLNHGYVGTGFFLFIGDKADLPEDQNGNPAIEEFTYGIELSGPQNAFQFTVPTTSMNACDDFVIVLTIYEIDLFGNLSNPEKVIFQGTPLLDLSFLNLCLDVC